MTAAADPPVERTPRAPAGAHTGPMARPRVWTPADAPPVDWPADAQPHVASGERAATTGTDLWSGRLVAASADWYTTAPAPRSWLLRDSRTGTGVLPIGEVGQLIAEGGAGKTMALCQLAVAVATGSCWLGALDVARAGRVLLALGEENSDEAKRRLYHAAKVTKHSTAPEPDSIVVLPLRGVPCPLIERDERGNPRDTDFARWLRGDLRQTAPWALVVVDPLT